MKIFNTWLTGLMLCLMASPLAAQTADVTQGCLPLTVNFTPPAGFSTFYWEFGDGVIAEEQNASHVYTMAGDYTVIFRESPNSPEIGSLTINVYNEPDLMVTANPPSGCGPLQVQFQNTTTSDPNISISNYLWDFGDGSNTTGENPSHVYGATGTFDVFLQISTNFASCNTTAFFTDLVTVAGPPNVGFVTSPDPAVACDAPLTVSFTNTTPNSGNYTFVWDFGNGTTSSLVTPDPVTYSADGSFTVSLTAIDNNNCSGTATQVVSIGDPPVVFSTPADTICIGDVIQIVNNSAPGSYNWVFGNGTVPNMSSQVSPFVQFNEAGNIPITLTVTTAGGCVNDSTAFIYVDAPDATFTSDPTYSCTSTLTSTFTPNNTNYASYFWDFGDETFSDEVSPSHTFINRDSTIHSINGFFAQEVTLVVTTTFGCVDTFVMLDTIHQPNALFAMDVANGCVPLTVTFADSSTNDFDLLVWEWDYGDGTTNTFNNSDDHTHVFTQPGEFPVTLTVTDELGCRDTSYSFVIEVGETLSPDFTVDATEICPGDSITFTPTNFPGIENVDAWHFETDEARSFHCFQEDELTWSFATQTGVMDATLYVEVNGCLSQITKTDLVQIKGPIAHIDYLVDCTNPLGISFRDSSDEASSVMWSFGDSTTSMLNDLIHTYDTTGVYTVVLTAENDASGCPASTDTATVYVRDIQAAFEPLDSLLCLGNPYELNALASQDVDQRCWKGYNWYFSDPNDRPVTTSNSSIEHVFESIGLNTFSLITEDRNGCLDTLSQTVRVYGVYPEFVADDNFICLGQLVNFNESTTGDTTLVEWTWDFGDGMPSMEMNPSHVITTSSSPDSAFITLSVMDALGCSGVQTLGIPLYEPQSIVTALPSTNICIGDAIDFSATDFTSQGSSLNFSWNFGNGQSSGNQTATVTYPNAGSFDVSLTYIEDATGCAGDPINFPVSVQDYPDADFLSNVDGQSVICYPQILLFDDNSTSTSPLNYFWQFDNGQSATGSSVSSGFAKGSYDVTLTVATSNGCIDDVTRTFTLVGPEGTLDIDRGAICNGDEVIFTLADTLDISSFTWDFGDGIVQNGGNPVTHTYDFADIPPGGQTTASLVLRGQDDICEFAIDTTIQIFQVIADFVRNDGIDTTVCLGDPFPLNDNSIDADIYNWDLGDGNTSNQSSPAHIYTTPGVYTVQLAVENSTLGCTDIIEKTVIVDQLPIVEAEGDTICIDDTAILSIANQDPNSNYLWSPAGLLDDPSSSNPETLTGSDLPNSVNTFSVMETDGNGCNGSDEVVVFVVPELNIGPLDTIVCPNETLVLPVSDETGLYNINYVWDENAATLSCQNCSLPLAMVNSSVVVSVTASDPYGCYDYAEDFSLEVFKEEEIQIPTAFTPDGDDVNDFFKVVLADEELQQITRFEIYNRWGQKVFDNDTPAGWDGNYKDKAVPADVYVYIIEITFAGCETYSRQGDVTLIR